MDKQKKDERSKKKLKYHELLYSINKENNL
jgi:hypothetical protein